MNALQDAISCLSDYDPNALPVEHAKRIIAGFLRPVTTCEHVAVRASLGRVLGAEVIATMNVPAHDNSAMDGYAIRCADLLASGETRLKRIGEAFAGRVFAGSVGPGECVRVMTGAVMPAGADTVIVQEITREDGAMVIIPGAATRGENVRYAGEDLERGKPMLMAGQVVGPAELGMIASMGLAEVTVKRRIRVAFFSTGD